MISTVSYVALESEHADLLLLRALLLSFSFLAISRETSLMSFYAKGFCAAGRCEAASWKVAKAAARRPWLRQHCPSLSQDFP